MDFAKGELDVEIEDEFEFLVIPVFSTHGCLCAFVGKGKIFSYESQNFSSPCIASGKVLLSRCVNGSIVSGLSAEYERSADASVAARGGGGAVYGDLAGLLCTPATGEAGGAA